MIDCAKYRLFLVNEEGKRVRGEREREGMGGAFC